MVMRVMHPPATGAAHAQPYPLAPSHPAPAAYAEDSAAVAEFESSLPRRVRECARMCVCVCLCVCLCVCVSVRLVGECESCAVVVRGQS